MDMVFMKQFVRKMRLLESAQFFIAYDMNVTDRILSVSGRNREGEKDP